MRLYVDGSEEGTAVSVGGALRGKLDRYFIGSETGDGMGVNLLDRPAEQFGQVFDDDPDPAATVNTIRRGLRELGLSA